MLGHRELTLEDYMRILRRRAWIIAIPIIVAPILAYIVTLWLPNRYTSQTLVLVENQKVPENYVRPVITEDLTYRLSTMEEQILSRSRLQPILERFHLYGTTDHDPALDEKLMKMRNNVKVKPVLSKMVQQPERSVPGFTISYTYSDPRIAQLVCGEITSMFIEANLKDRQQSAEGTTQFLEKQLQESKQKLDEQDSRLAKFKSRYIGQLPEQSQTNINILMGLKAQLEAATAALSRAQQDKTYTESLLAQQGAAWEMSQKDGAGASPNTLQQQLAALQSQLVTLQGHYTDDYPDVVKTKRDIAELKKQLAAAETTPPKETGAGEKKVNLLEPPQIQQLRVSVRQYEQTIKEKSREEERLQEQIRTYEGRVQLTPMVEEEYKQLTRDYQSALGFYNELLAKKSQSEMATSLELQQRGEQFRVMDPPNRPDHPSFPNRPLITLGGLGGGLGLGLVLAFLLELTDRSLRTEADVAHLLRLPALAVVPDISEEPGGERQDGNIVRFRFWKRKADKAVMHEHVGV